MAGYTKLFSDIVTSTIWQAPNDQRVLWITLLALKGGDNICRATVPALAKMCDLTIENCEKYLELFQQPDKYSRSQEHEGRRIQAVAGGWFLLNGDKYQYLLSKEERKEYNRQKTARSRERHRARDQKLPPLPIVTNNTPSPLDTSPSQEESQASSTDSNKDKNTPVVKKTGHKQPTSSFSKKPDPSWEDGHKKFAETQRTYFSDPMANIMDVLNLFRVSFDLKGVPINQEWREKTEGQTALQVFEIFAAAPEGAITLPSHYKKFREAA